MSINRKTLLLCVLLLLGLAFLYIGFNISPLGLLATIGAWVLLGLLYYDKRRAQKKWEQQHT